MPADERELHVSTDEILEAEPYQPPARGCSPTASCLISGCLGGMALALLLFAAGMFLVWRFGKPVITEAVAEGLTQTIQQSSMKEEDKTGLIHEVHRVRDAFQGGRISLENIQRIVESIGDSPAIIVGSLYAANDLLVQPSGLTDDEKAAAWRTLQRVARGYHEGKISDEDLEDVVEPLSDQDGNGNVRFSNDVNDEDLRAALEKAKALADQAEVPDEDFEIDVVGEVRQIVDQVLPQD